MVDPDDGEEGSLPASTSGKPPASTQPAPASGSQQGGDIQSYIGARLRKAFDDVAKQPVPDRFLQLMAELDRQ